VEHNGNRTLKFSSPASPDSPLLRAQRDDHEAEALEPLRVMLVGGRAVTVGPLDIDGRRVEVVGFAERVDEAASMAELYRPDVVVVTANGTAGGLPIDLLGAVLKLASARPDAPHS